MFQKMLENVRGKCPLIHNITNYVTVNDCANIVLACGASPIMSDDQSEVEEITTICGGLNINIGTLNKRTIESMLLAGKRANERRRRRSSLKRSNSPSSAVTSPRSRPLPPAAARPRAWMPTSRTR